MGASALGYAYIEGARAERGKQAREVAALNLKIAALNKKIAEEDATEDVRVANALAKARTILASDPTGTKCKLTQADAARLRSVLGSQ